MRLPNVFTAIADVAMGYLFVRGPDIEAIPLALLIATSAALYTAGMVLNDLFDYRVDAVERPFRPLPSGQISLAAAKNLGFGLLIVGLMIGWVFEAVVVNSQTHLIAMLLVIAIVGYDIALKKTILGPLAMGACRFLNVLLGMSAVPRPGLFDIFSTGELLAAAGIGVYIVGVTWFARSEAETSPRVSLMAAMGIMTGGVIVLAASAVYVPKLTIELHIYWLLLALLSFSVLRRCAAAALDPRPEKVQAAVKHSILSLIWLDAATAIAVAGPLPGLAIAALLIPALILGRWVYST
jgi:4-hydroxybenzoate polyprenyltransferase